MDATPRDGRKRGSIRIPKEVERLVFFYATVGMFLLWGCSKIFGN
jgi:hypothetical protein